MIDLSYLKQKPKRIKLANNVDYLKLYYILRNKFTSSYLFESLALPRQQDRYYAFGFDPEYTFSAKEKNLIISKGEKIIKEAKNVNPYQEISNLFPKIPASKTHEGGLIGYFSYETINYFEPKLNLNEHIDFPVFELGLYTDGLIYDSETAELTYYTYSKDRSSLIIKLIDNIDSVNLPDKMHSIINEGVNVEKSEYLRAVANTVEHIKKGNTFQAEVGFRFNYTISGDKFAIYNRLRQVNPSPYMYYMKFEDRELFGASPEMVVSLNSGRVMTTPAAGTIARGKNNIEDTKLARELLNDPKEVAEHSMLVDMHRNDISKVCKPGSVKISRLMHLMKFSYVQHIVSDIVGDLDSEKNAFDLLSSILPCGVLTGAPKIETIKIINENEKSPRGPYGGAVGRFSFNGDCAFAMPIRSLFCKGDKCFSSACSGVVYDSEPENEYNEIVSKLKAMDKTLMEVA